MKRRPELKLPTAFSLWLFLLSTACCLLPTISLELYPADLVLCSALRERLLALSRLSGKEVQFKMRRITPTKLFGSLALLLVALPGLAAAQGPVDARAALTAFPESQA